jgi:hypothetical protein
LPISPRPRRSLRLNPSRRSPLRTHLQVERDRGRGDDLNAELAEYAETWTMELCDLGDLCV